MKQLFPTLAAALALPLIFLFFLSGSESAVITVENHFVNTSVYCPDDEEPVPPVYTPQVFTVRRGDRIAGGSIAILHVTKSAVTFRMFDQFYGAGRASDCFTIRRGETLSLSQVGICDASNIYNIAFPE